MATKDTVVSVAPYFNIHREKEEVFRNICERFVAKTATEAGCLYYGFTFKDDLAICREGFNDAAALIAHIQNLSPIVAENDDSLRPIQD